jgi:hypothetical protein
MMTQTLPWLELVASYLYAPLPTKPRSPRSSRAAGNGLRVSVAGMLASDAPPFTNIPCGATNPIGNAPSFPSFLPATPSQQPPPPMMPRSTQRVPPKSRKPSNKCPHNRQTFRCKECGGIGLCQHNRRKGKCKECVLECGGQRNLPAQQTEGAMQRLRWHRNMPAQQAEGAVRRMRRQRDLRAPQTEGRSAKNAEVAGSASTTNGRRDARIALAVSVSEPGSLRESNALASR